MTEAFPDRQLTIELLAYLAFSQRLAQEVYVRLFPDSSLADSLLLDLAILLAEAQELALLRFRARTGDSSIFSSRTSTSWLR